MSRKSKKRKQALATSMESSAVTDKFVYSNTYSKVCHSGIVKVMDIGKTVIYAGGFKDVKFDWDWDVMLRLSEGDFQSHFPLHPINLNKEAKQLFPKIGILSEHTPAIIDIYWPDYGEPYIPAKWWVSLNEAIKKLPASVMVVHCIGGHGRTGTALAILAGLNGYHKFADGNPVEYIRNVYCKDAVESMEQIKYIKKVTRLEFTSTVRSWFNEYNRPSILYPEKSDLTPTQVSALTPTPIEAEWEDGGVTYVYAGDKIYKKSKDGKLFEVEVDDGSYYGRNHSTTGV